MNRRRWLVNTTALLGSLLFIGWFAAAATGLDPGDSVLPVRLHNDGGGPVVAKQCDSRCDVIHDRVVLRPGATIWLNTSSDNVANWWVATAPSGRVLGCYPFQYDHYVADIVVSVSQFRPCPRNIFRHEVSETLGPIVTVVLLICAAGIVIMNTIFATGALNERIKRRVRQPWRGLILGAVAFVVLLLGWGFYALYTTITTGARFARRRGRLRSGVA